MRLTKEEIGQRAQTLAGQIKSSKLRIEIIDGESVIAAALLLLQFCPPVCWL